jgi:hypothetical protein
MKHLSVLLEPGEVRDLLSRLCIQFGFCLPPIEIEKLAASPPMDIDLFTEAVFVAEGYGFTKSDPLCARTREVIAEAFIQTAAKLQLLHDDHPDSGEPDAPVGVPRNPRPSLHSGAIALPEPEFE